jgi:hypothetical protein
MPIPATRQSTSLLPPAPQRTSAWWHFIAGAIVGAAVTATVALHFRQTQPRPAQQVVAAVETERQDALVAENEDLHSSVARLQHELDQPRTPSAPRPHAATPVVSPPLRSPAGRAVATGEALPDESESDRRRAQGLRDFERAVQTVARRADQIDIRWRQYETACENDRTSVDHDSQATDPHGRAWFVIWTSTIQNEDTRYCQRLLSQILSLGRQVKEGMDAAQDGARQAGVYPGDCRTIRERHRMDWSGWH